jgi:hypothetical protein
MKVRRRVDLVTRSEVGSALTETGRFAAGTGRLGHPRSSA